jgi:hypothetical protein
MPASRTALGTGIPCVESPDRTAIPSGFVLKLADQLPPAHIRTALCQRVILQHIFAGQRLEADHLVLADDARRQLVLEIAASVGNAGVYLRALATGLLSILRLLLFPGVATLPRGEALFIPGKEPLIARLFPRRKPHHVMQAQVSSNRLGRHRQGRDVLFDQEADKVTPGGILGHGDGGRPGIFGQRTAPVDRQRRAHLGKQHLLAIPLKRRRRVLRRLATMLLLGGRLLGAALKEVLEGFIQMAQRLLGRHTGPFTQPGRGFLLLERRQGCRGIPVEDVLPTLPVRVRPETPRPVIHKTRTAKRTSKIFGLLVGRVTAVLIGAFVSHTHLFSFNQAKPQRGPGGFLPFP